MCCSFIRVPVLHIGRDRSLRRRLWPGRAAEHRPSLQKILPLRAAIRAGSQPACDESDRPRRGLKTLWVFWGGNAVLLVPAIRVRAYAIAAASPPEYCRAAISPFPP